MPTTTNYGWTTPADTDLVKDGAAAIRTLGSSIDTTVYNNANAAIAKTIVDAKGDIIAATAADTVARLAVGANDTVLTADSSTATGLKWAAASGGISWSLLNSGGTTLTGATTITVSGISGKNHLMIIVRNASAGAEASFSLRFNSDSGANYSEFGSQRSFNATYNRDQAEQILSNTSTTEITLGRQANGSTSTLSGFCLISGTNTTAPKIYQAASGVEVASTNNSFSRTIGGYYNGSSTISSVSIISDYLNFDNGTIYVYASA